MTLQCTVQSMYAPGFHFRLQSASELGEQHDYLEFRDSDHHEWSEDFQKDETDYREWYNEEKGKTLLHCESQLLSEINHEDQDPNTTDPFLVHELFVPYNHMPRPRIFHFNGKNFKYIVTALPRRSRSPIRQILPGRFDLRTRTEELLKQQNITKARRYLQESKDRILQSVKQISNVDVDSDVIICILILRALCEQVILTMEGTNTGIDVRTFVNMTIISALVDLEILDPITLDEQEQTVFIKLGLFGTRPRSREVVACSKLRRDLLEVHRSKFDLYILTHLHRCLPWPLVGPTHQRGIIKFYPNVRERIDEKLSDFTRCVKSAYVPDLTCFHFGEVPDRTYMTHNKKFIAKKD